MDLSASLSAFRAYGLRQETAAHNVANVNTSGYKPYRVELQEVEDRQGVRGDVVRLSGDSAGLQPAGGDPVEQGSEADWASTFSREPSHTDLAVEMVTMMENETAYSANAAVIRTSQEMSGELLDLLA
jgi:flagellar basal-body rod protein FlgC